MDFEEREIDERFYNSDTNAPFETCLVCSKRLLESEDDYFIERIFRKLPGDDESVEPLFEYALCKQCAENFRNELSKESLDRIEAYFMEHVALHNQRGIKPGTERCLLTGKPIRESSEFSYHAHCQGNKLLHSIFPYAISDEAMDEMSELLSNHTLDQLDDFKGTHFSGPPEVADLLNPKRLLPL